MKKAIKIILWIICFLLIVFFIASAALPAWISSESGTRTVLKWINSRIDGKLSAEKVELSWLGAQRVENAKLEDPTGNVIFSVHLFETDTSLLYLLFGGRSLNRTVVEAPFLVLARPTPEKKDLESKEIDTRTVKKKKKTRFKSYPTFDDTLYIRKGTLIVTEPNRPFVTLADINVSKELSPSRLQIQANTIQETARGSILIEAQLENPLQAHAQIQNFPVAVLDALSNSISYSDAIGQTLNAELNMKREGEQALYINGSIQSPNLNAYVDGITEKGQFIVNPQTHLEFTLTPAFFKQLIEEKNRKDWDLASKTAFTVQIEKGVFPLSLKKSNFQDIILQANAKLNRAELNHKTLGSYSLKQFDLTITALNNLEIVWQGDIQGKEATKLDGHASINGEGNVLFDCNIQGFPVALLSLVSTTLENNTRMLFGNNFDMQYKGTFIDHFLDSTAVLDAHNSKLTCHLTATPPEFQFDLTGIRTVRGEKARVLGQAVNFSLRGSGSLQDGHVSIPFVKGSIFNPYFEVDLRGQIGKEAEVFSFENVQFMATGHIKKLPIEETLPEPALQNGTFYLQADGSKNLMIGKIESHTADANFELRHFIHNDEIDFKNADLNFSCELHDFPTTIISAFLADDLDLTLFFGKALSLTSKGNYTPSQKPQLSLDINAQGSGFSASLAIALDDTLTVRQHRPSYVYWEITPERYDALIRLFKLDPSLEPTFVLTRPTQLELNITQLTCPTTFPENLSHFICQSGFVGDVRLGTMIFRSKQTNESMTFQEITGTIKGENFSEKIDLTLTGNIVAPNIPSSEKSAFSFEGQMFNFWTKQGKFNRERLTVKGVLSLDLLPVRQVTGIVPLDQQTRELVQAVLGELVNARIYGEISQLSGPLTVDIKSSNFKTKLALQLQPHAIFLRELLDAEITLTPAVNETLIKDINPLLLTGAYSDHPLKVYIDPQGFMLPIRPYALQGVQIGKAIIDIGKIQVRNGGQIQSLMQFLNAKDITPDGRMEAWFTPIFMSLHDGVATYKRFDALLAGNVHIAMWGSINLINDGVRMTLAIAPTTLYQRFKVSGLTKKDMFQVKMRGTTTNLDLDWSSAYTRIAFIIARTAGGHIGYIIGGILEQLIGHLGEEPAPPPTTDPLPWETLYPSDPGQDIPQEAPSKSKGRSASKKLIDFLIP